MITSETMSRNQPYDKCDAHAGDIIAGAVLPDGFSAWIIKCSKCLGCTNDSTNSQVLRRCPICGAKPPADSHEWVRCECGCNLFCCIICDDLIISIVMAPDIIYEEDDII